MRYTYDAWGRKISTTGTMASILGYLNPFRYRGYVYDEETGLYYLQSRYYNPLWARFLNADAILGSNRLLSMNLFCYCRNNPVNRNDINGYTSSIAQPIWNFIGEYGQSIMMADANLPFCDAIVFVTAGVAVGASIIDGIVDFWNHFINRPADSSPVTLSDNIDWGSGDHNHILGGSKNHGGHDWGKFGINPGDPKGWEKLVPILKIVADKGEQYGDVQSKAGGTLRSLLYHFISYEESVVLRLFYGSDGRITISDAWPLSR